eukprot:UN21373
MEVLMEDYPRGIFAKQNSGIRYNPIYENYDDRESRHSKPDFQPMNSHLVHEGPNQLQDIQSAGTHEDSTDIDDIEDIETVETQPQTQIVHTKEDKEPLPEMTKRTSLDDAPKIPAPPQNPDDT